MAEIDSGITVCVTGSFQDVASIDRFLAENPDIVDSERFLFEMRLDLLSVIDDSVFDVISRLRGKAIVSCRSRLDGGCWKGTEVERLAVLARAAGAGPGLVDVELATWMRGGAESIRRACRGGCRIMVSVHENGSSEFFGDLAAKLNRTGASALKLAGVTRDAGDLVRLATAGRNLSAEIRCVVGMGAAGPFSRMRPADFGASMTFASAAPGIETADGQIDFRKLSEWRVFQSSKLEPIVLAGGDQVVRSPGPDIYNRLFADRSLNLQYLALPVSDWGQVVEAGRCFGITRFAVTMPYKTAPLKAWPDAVCDEWTTLTGIANTVVVDHDRVRLFNTDATGTSELFDRLGGVLDKDVLILGGGATARSVAAAAIRGGAVVSIAARNSVMVGREWPTGMSGIRFKGWEKRGEHSHDIVVNATPVGADGRSTPIDCSGLRAELAAIDVVVTGSGQTAFIAEAVKLGLKRAGGLDFWCAQAPAQLRVFTGVDIDCPAVAAAMEQTGHKITGLMAEHDSSLPGEGLDAVNLAVPGSKSITQRYLVLASLSRYPSRLLHPSPCRDSLEMQHALGMLGVRFGRTSDALDIYPADFPRDPGRVVPTGEGGTTLRFMAALSLLCEFPLQLQPSGAMTHRPMDPMWDALASLGVRTSHEGSVHTLERTDFSGSSCRVDGTISSQFASALLMAGIGMPGGIRIELADNQVSMPYLDMTVDAIRQFGGVVEIDDGVIRSSRGTDVMGLRLNVEYDASLAAFWDAASAISGRKIVITNRPATGALMQGDSAFGAFSARLAEPGDAALDLSGTPDLLPPLVLIALFRGASTAFCGIEHVRTKESDRLSVLASALGSIGADIKQSAQGLTVTPARLRGPAILDPRGDHRMAMTFGILSLRVPGLRVLNPECVDKSYPAFWQDLEKVRN